MDSNQVDHLIEAIKWSERNAQERHEQLMAVINNSSNRAATELVNAIQNNTNTIIDGRILGGRR